MSDLASFHNQVKTGDLDSVRSMLDADPLLLNQKNTAGQTAFQLAKYYRQEAVASELLSREPDLDVYTAAIAGRAPQVLTAVDADAALLETTNSDGWTLLHLAAFFGQIELAKALALRGATIDARSTNAMKNTPLHAATAGRQIALAIFLLEHEANPNAQQEGGWAALHAAAQTGDLDLLSVLLEHGADPSIRADNQQTPLDLALLHGKQHAAALLEPLDQKPN